MRAFAAGLFAVVALGTAALLTPVLGLPSRRLAIAMPFLAAAFAYGWAWLLHPSGDAQVYGARRGAIVALLAYSCFGAVLAILGHREAAAFLVVGFVWTPLPWLVPIAGAAAGDANLHNARVRVDASFKIVRRGWATGVATIRARYLRLDERTADLGATAIVTMIVSSCLLFAGAAVGLALFPPGLAFSDPGVDISGRLLPGAAALILAMAGWLCGRVLLAIMPTAYRLRITLMSVILAGIAARLATSVVV